MLQFGSNIFYFFLHRTFYFLFQGAEPSDNAYAGSLISQWRRVDKTLSGGKQVCCFPDVDGIIFRFSIFILPVHLLCIWMAQLNLPVNCNVTKCHSGLSRTYYLNSRWGEVPTARCAGGGFHITDLLNNNEHNDMDKLFPMYDLLKNEIWHCTNYLPRAQWSCASWRTKIPCLYSIIFPILLCKSCELFCKFRKQDFYHEPS